ncbi:MAG: lysophospholipid acyltransferase family protein [Myxococcales bacterium]|nr:lysophospholipid acyltransferase family protein [Myxococcales bacterium]
MPSDGRGRLTGGVRAAGRALGLLASTAAMLVAAELDVRVRGEPALRWDRWIRRWAQMQLRLFGAEVRCLGSAPAPRAGRLVVANHRSPLDVVVLLSRFGGRLLARADLARWPVLGEAARRAGTLFVDRGEHRSGARALRAIRRALAAGQTVHVFPEGTTVAGDEVRPFHAGAFAAVRGLDADVVPVGLAYPAGVEFTEDSFVAHLRRVAARPRTPVGVAIGAPLTLDGDATALAQRARQSVAALVREARSLVG